MPAGAPMVCLPALDAGAAARAISRGGVVLSKNRSWSGNQVLLLRHKGRLRGLLRDRRWRTARRTRYWPAPCYNVHAVIGDAGVEVSRPSIQIVVPEADLGGVKLNYRGNFFFRNSRIDPVVVDRVHSVIRFAGRRLALRGYRGLAGLNVLADRRQARIIDVNPRFQGSTPASR